jgi:hypothetical protein
MESNMESPQKTKIRTAIWSCETTPGHKSEGYNKDMFTVALSTIVKLWK